MSKNQKHRNERLKAQSHNGHQAALPKRDHEFIDTKHMDCTNSTDLKAKCDV